MAAVHGWCHRPTPGSNRTAQHGSAFTTTNSVLTEEGQHVGVSHRGVVAHEAAQLGGGHAQALQGGESNTELAGRMEASATASISRAEVEAKFKPPQTVRASRHRAMCAQAAPRRVQLVKVGGSAAQRAPAPTCRYSKFCSSRSTSSCNRRGTPFLPPTTSARSFWERSARCSAASWGRLQGAVGREGGSRLGGGGRAATRRGIPAAPLSVPCSALPAAAAGRGKAGWSRDRRVGSMPGSMPYDDSHQHAHAGRDGPGAHKHAPRPTQQDARGPRQHEAPKHAPVHCRVQQQHPVGFGQQPLQALRAQLLQRRGGGGTGVAVGQGPQRWQLPRERPSQHRRLPKHSTLCDHPVRSPASSPRLRAPPSPAAGA